MPELKSFFIMGVTVDLTHKMPPSLLYLCILPFYHLRPYQTEKHTFMKYQCVKLHECYTFATKKADSFFLS